MDDPSVARQMASGGRGAGRERGGGRLPSPESILGCSGSEWVGESAGQMGETAFNFTLFNEVLSL